MIRAVALLTLLAPGTLLARVASGQWPVASRVGTVHPEFSAQQKTPPRAKSKTTKKSPSKPTLAQLSIAAAQKVSVHALDPALPDQPFAEWFQSVVGRDLKLTWESNDCGEQTGNPANTPADPPVCGQASAKLPDGRTVIAMISVGTAKQGIAGAPAVAFIGLAKETAFDQVQTLSELPAAIAGQSP